MGDDRHGVIFAASEEHATNFFSDLEPKTFLRLTLLDTKNVWGIYAEGWPGDGEILNDIARLASITFGKSVRYRYADAVGFLSDLYEQGQRTKTEDADDRSVPRIRGDVFQIFGLKQNMHEVVEAAFTWAGNDNWVLEIVPEGKQKT